MAKRGDNTSHHNDGQSDASNNKYSPPHEHPFGIYDDSDIADRNAYREGWNHTNDQKESSSSSGGCFLSTACVAHAGLGDNCNELVVLRRFRDNVLAKSSDGRSKISKYYEFAPRLVNRIDNSANKHEIYESAFHEIQEIVSLIEHGADESAVFRYETLISNVEQRI